MFLFFSQTNRDKLMLTIVKNTLKVEFLWVNIFHLHYQILNCLIGNLFFHKQPTGFIYVQNDQQKEQLSTIIRPIAEQTRGKINW